MMFKEQRSLSGSVQKLDFADKISIFLFGMNIDEEIANLEQDVRRIE